MGGRELGPGSPPKSRALEVLNAERECQAKAGPWKVGGLLELLNNCHRGFAAWKGRERERHKSSLLFGAEVYE